MYVNKFMLSQLGTGLRIEDEAGDGAGAGAGAGDGAEAGGWQ